MPDQVQQAIALVDALLQEHRIDKGHGLDHALAVLKHAERALAVELEPSADERLAVRLAALLHDVDDRKFFASTDLDNARAICAAVAPRQPDVQALALRMIALVSCSKNGNTLVEPSWLLIPRWADRLEALGAIGIYRCYVYTLHVGRPLLTDATELPASEQDLERLAPPERFAQYVQLRGQVGSSSFVDHFYDKLLHIAVLPTRNAYLLRKAAERRRVMINFLLRLDRADPMRSIGPICCKYEA
jgi:uncharacterized protein